MNDFPKKLAGQVRATPRLPSVAIGFDGFVDEMISVVSERQSLTNYATVPDIATFGGLITRAAGHSSLREIVINAVHPGGCAVNTGDGLAALGVPVDVFATLGQPMHAAFQQTAARFQSCQSWGGEPGRTLAYEFSDGKLMFSAVSQLADFTPKQVEELLTDDAYAAACTAARVIALTDWTLYPHMTAVWSLLQERVYSRLKHRPAFFIDLVDPSSRSSSDILAMLAVLPRFEQCGPLTLGLNGNEANILARLLNLTEAHDDPEASLRLGQELRKQLGISEVLVHHIKSAALASLHEPAFQRGPYCDKPKKSTGAGDRFNAGYILGLLLQLDGRSRLACACACAGFFVRQARSATLPELADFIETILTPCPEA